MTALISFKLSARLFGLNVTLQMFVQQGTHTHRQCNQNLEINNYLFTGRQTPTVFVSL